MSKKIKLERQVQAGPDQIKKQILLLVIGSLLFLSALSQENKYAFNPGEQVTYGAYYNWHFIWLHAGEVNFSTDTILENHQSVLSLKAVGKTFKTYDLFYSVRDTFESKLIYDSFIPVHFWRVMNHAKKSSSHEYNFDSSNGIIASHIKRNDEELAVFDTLKLAPNTFDLLSTAYYFRSFQFTGMKKHELFKFKMLVDNKLEDLYFRYLGEDEVKTREGEKFLCHKISVMLLEGDFFPKGEHMKVWFTKDENKLPIMVETEISVGYVKAILTGYSNLKYPLTSKIIDNGKH
ncbi:DUF3108 domain-containing protein [Sunxiuqinia sp. A32]|uniref:DUF3108 domain-containing protein n=1 Tax=Sunxiuqinia sp. A32 TaxID=3461496 RepID=UPI0040453847